MQIFVPLTKIDEEKRLVIGRAVQEVPDKSGEILDYATAVPAFKSWSEQFERATGGLSKGNLRAMHNPRSVAGKVTDLVFNDDEKAIDIAAKVVDDQEWRKVLDGVYTGFSVGGSYLKKWDDNGLKRYTPKVSEISLVDSPCIPTCRIAELHKSDGSVVEHLLKGRAPRSYAELAPPRSYGELEKAEGFSLTEAYLAKTDNRERRSAWARARDVATVAAVPFLTAAGGGVAGAGLGAAAGLAARRMRRSNLPNRGMVAGSALLGGLLGTKAGWEGGIYYGARGATDRLAHDVADDAASRLTEAQLRQRRDAARASARKRRRRAEKAEGFSLTEAYLEKAWGAGIARLGRQAVQRLDRLGARVGRRLGERMATNWAGERSARTANLHNRLGDAGGYYGIRAARYGAIGAGGAATLGGTAWLRNRRRRAEKAEGFSLTEAYLAKALPRFTPGEATT